MTTNKKKKPTKKSDIFWRVIIGTGALLGVLGGLYGIDAMYVRTAYHSLCMAETKKDISEIQKQVVVQRTYDEVFFWQRTEIEITKALAAHPNDKALKLKLEEIQKNKKEAEDRLKKIQ